VVVKKRVSKRKDLEHIVQCAICDFLDFTGLLYFAIPNGGNRNIITATKLKREGVKAGVPDLCIIHKGSAFFLEVKTPKTETSRKGTVSKRQVEVFGKLTAEGCQVEVVHSVAETREVLERWGIDSKRTKTAI